MPFDFRAAHPFAMGHLRLKRLWLCLGVLLILLVVALSLVDLGPKVDLSFNDKVAHLIIYAGLMGWFSQLFRHDLTRLLLALGFTALGIAVEFLQGMTAHRQFELLDMLANTSGVLLAWALAYTRVGDALPAIERVLIRLRLVMRRVAGRRLRRLMRRRQRRAANA